jgi:hypothetical protein
MTIGKKARYLEALLAVLGARPRRKKKPPAVLAKWLAVEKRADLRSFFQVLTERDPGYTSVGDLLVTDDVLGSRAARPGDNAARGDVIVIARSAGPDVFVVAAPGTSTSSRVLRLSPRDDWKERREGASLDDFLRACVEEAHHAGEETELDSWVGEPRRPARTTAKPNRGRAPHVDLGHGVRLF